MAIYLKRYGFAITKYDVRNTGISGSSRFENITSWWDDVLQVKVKKKLFETDKIVNVVGSVENEEDVSKKPRMYGVDRKRLMDRLNAYVCLSRSRKFLAFYSVSFPAGNSDDIIVRLWNSCLTNLREKLKLKSYIWVMERQRNGTIHYHMLTNDYMPVRGVNSIVANSIDHYVKKGLMSWGNSSVILYNGVDVENISKRCRFGNKSDKRKAYTEVVRYVTKYMSKNSEKESHRQWHCSRLVSALYVTAYLTPDEVNVLFEEEEALLENKRVVESEHATVILFSAIESAAWKETVEMWNNRVYDYFERNSLW